MRTSRLPWNVKKMVRMRENGTLNFDYPIQRKGGQWDDLQKSLLINSIAGSYPIPQILVLSVDGVDYVLDGKQRVLNAIGYVVGKKDPETEEYPKEAYKLHEETPNINLDGTDVEFEMAGKYFDELHEDLQQEILNQNLYVIKLEDVTDEEIQELFFRWNNGTPLTKQQKARAKMGVANASVISELLNHSFLQERASFTSLQRRRSDDEAVVLQTMMLLDENYELESFVADKILKYATDMQKNDITPITNQIKDALDYADMSINETLPLLKKVHLPTFLLVAKKAFEDDVPSEVFGAWADDFGKAINARTIMKALVKTDYKKYTGAGSVKKTMVLGRKEAMLEHFGKFIKVYEPVIEDPFTEEKNEDVENTNVAEAGLDVPKEDVQTDEVNTMDLFEGHDNSEFGVMDEIVENIAEETTTDETESDVEKAEDAEKPEELQEELQLGEDIPVSTKVINAYNESLEMPEELSVESTEEAGEAVEKKYDENKEEGEEQQTEKTVKV